MSENVVETILVKLGLDSSGFSSSAEKAIKTNDKLNSSVADTDKAVNGVVKSISKWLGAVAAATGIAKLTLDVAKLNDELGFLEANLGMSAQSIRAWQGAAGAMGGSADGMTSSIKSLNMGMNDFITMGDTSLLPFMNALGVGMVDANGKLRDTDKVMLDLADSFSKMDREQAFSLASKMGIDEGTFNTLVNGREEMEKMIEYQKTMYQSSEKELQASRELQKNRALIGQQWASIKTMLANTVIPLFVKLSEVALGIFEYLQQHQQEVQAFFTGLSFVVGAVLIPVLVKAAIAAAAFLAPILLAAAPVIALGAAFGILYDDYKTWAEGGKSLFDWGVFANYIDKATLTTENLGKAFKQLGKDIMNDTIPTIMEYVKIIEMLSKGDFKGAASHFGGLAGNFSEKATGYVDTALGLSKGGTSDAIGGFIASAIDRMKGGKGGAVTRARPNSEAALLDLIAKGEVGTTGRKGYETAYRGSRVTAQSMFGKDLTELTIGEVKQLQKASLREQGSRGIPASKRSSAMGRYQFINTGFDDYINAAGLSDKDMFSPENQDAMAVAMMRRGKYGLDAVRSGKATEKQFQDNVLAKRWASIKTSQGRGVYDNDGINRASHGSISEVQKAMRQGAYTIPSQTQARVSGGNKTDVTVQNVQINTTSATMTGVGQDMAKGIGNNIGMLVNTTN